jgi:hypothetical protein
MNVTKLSQFENHGIMDLNNFMKILTPLSVGLLCPLTILLTLLLISKTKRYINSSPTTRARITRYANLQSIAASRMEGENSWLLSRPSDKKHDSDSEDEQRHAQRFS